MRDYHPQHADIFERQIKKNSWRRKLHARSNKRCPEPTWLWRESMCALLTLESSCGALGRLFPNGQKAFVLRIFCDCRVCDAGTLQHLLCSLSCVEEFFLAKRPGSSVEVRGLVIHDNKKKTSKSHVTNFSQKMVNCGFPNSIMSFACILISGLSLNNYEPPKIAPLRQLEEELKLM